MLFPRKFSTFSFDTILQALRRYITYAKLRGHGFVRNLLSFDEIRLGVMTFFHGVVFYSYHGVARFGHLYHGEHLYHDETMEAGYSFTYRR